jgi:hypothetical protein
MLAARGLAGGTLVVIFALVSQMVTPKAFSGLFSAAPSVAFASLAIIIVAESAARARQATIGMVIGGIAMGASCIVAAVAIPRIKSLRGSIAGWLSWAAVDLGLYWAVFVGAQQH